MSSLRFTEAIDMCAMRTGAAETDDYLAEWRKADPVPVSDDLEAEADKAASELETAYDRERLIALVKAGAATMADPALKPGNAAPGAKAASGAYTPAGVSPNRRARRKYTVRLWAVRHSRFLEWFYRRFADAFLLLHRSGRKSATSASNVPSPLSSAM